MWDVKTAENLRTDAIGFQILEHCEKRRRLSRQLGALSLSTACCKQLITQVATTSQTSTTETEQSRVGQGSDCARLSQHARCTRKTFLQIVLAAAPSRNYFSELFQQWTSNYILNRELLYLRLKRRPDELC